MLEIRFSTFELCSAPMRALVALIFMAGLSGCAAPHSDSVAFSDTASGPAATTSAAGKPGSSDKASNTAGATIDNLTTSQPDRYLIRNATVTIEASDVSQAARKLSTAVAAAHGYVVESHETVDDLGIHALTTKVRVPAPEFDGSVVSIESLGKVLEKQVTAEDVTEEFVDSQAKLRNLNRTEDRLLSHLSNTGRLSDTLLVEKELNRVREESDELSGRLKYLAHRVTFSTIEVTFKQKARPQPLAPAESFSSGKIASEAIRSLVAFLETVFSTAIWLMVWCPVWLPLTIVGYGIRRYLVAHTPASAHHRSPGV